MKTWQTEKPEVAKAKPQKANSNAVKRSKKVCYH
jgi:hypothetical protein